MRKITYTDAPKDLIEAIETGVDVTHEFRHIFPIPKEYLRREKKQRITIALDEESLNLFRSYAKEHNAKYQNLINDVIKTYAKEYLAKIES